MLNVRFSDELIRILDLANYIERLPDGAFNMECWLNDRHEPSCIAAYAVWRSIGDYLPVEARLARLRSTSIPEAAAHYLGVYGSSLRRLFTPGWDDLEDSPPLYASQSRSTVHARSRISKEWAAAVLRHFAATGVVDWKAAKRDMGFSTVRALSPPELELVS